MKVIVTGATGNVGTQVVAALSADPAVHTVVGVARRPGTTAVPKVTWVAADISVDPLGELFAGADAVIHLAWLIQPVRNEQLLRSVNVEGTRRVVEAAIGAGVGLVVYASSIGAYAPDDATDARDESWPHTGIATSVYSRHKAEVEALLDDLESSAGSTRVVRMRMALVFQRHAASEIRRYFLGPFAPSRLIGRHGLPVFPHLENVRIQVVHARDAAAAYLAALHHPGATGAFNIAADRVLTTRDLAAAFGARAVPVPRKLLRAGAAITFALRLQPTSPGWVDLALGAPVMDTTAARTILNWRPAHSATTTVAELLDGFAHGAGTTTPVLCGDREQLPFPTIVERVTS